MSPRILIVDDEANQRRALSIGLRLEGLPVETAASGEEALAVLDTAAASDQPFDVALVDLMMPGIHGIDVALEIERRGLDTVVVLTSAYHLSRRQLEDSGARIFAFMPKPYDMMRLVDVLKDAAASAQEASNRTGIHRKSSGAAAEVLALPSKLPVSSSG